MSAVLTLSDSGVKTARVRIHTSHCQEPFTLSLRAIGRRSQQLTINRRHVEVSAGATATVHLQYVDYDDDHAPPPPIVDEHPAWAVEVGTWTLLQPRSPELQLPARWQLTLTISSNEENVGTGQTTRLRHRFTIRVGDQPQTTLNVRSAARRSLGAR